jgi:hypothetical protein
VRLSSATSFDFSTGSVATLGPGEYVVAVRNLEAFATRYDVNSIKVAGQYSRNLNDRSGTIVLTGPLDETIQRFGYDTTWYASVSSEGHSLVIKDPLGPAAAWGQSDGWRASLEPGGSPGRADGEEPQGGLQKPGDFIQDGRLDVSDAAFLLLHLFGGSTVPLPCGGASAQEGGNLTLLDSNGDVKVDAADAVYILNYLFLRGAPLVQGTACVRIAGCPDVCPR